MTEQRIGYRLNTPTLSADWIQSLHVSDMSGVWKKVGIPAIGVNYFTMGHIENGLSTHFDPESPFFQAWVGGYLFQLPKGYVWSKKTHYALVVEDQKKWLRACGDPNPSVEVDEKSVQETGTFSISGFTASLFTGAIWSNADVGRSCNRLFPGAIGIYESFFFGKGNPALSFSQENFIPRFPHPLVSNFQKMYLQGFGAYLKINNTTKAILYANATTYVDSRGKKHTTFPRLKKRLMEAIKRFEILQV